MNDSPVPNDAALQAPVHDEIATPELVASLLADGDDELAAWAIGQALLERPRSAVFDTVIRRAMELVGTRWESDQWTVAEEHLASVALAAALARIRPPDDPQARIGPVAVLAGPEVELHVAGLACLAQVLEESGWQVNNLGANVPADDLVRFVSNRTVDLVALSVATAWSLPAARRAVEALRAASSAVVASLPIAVGGRGASALEGQMAGADFVSTSLAEAEVYAKRLAARLRGDQAPLSGQ